MKTFCFVCGLLGSFLILTSVQAAFTDVPSSQVNYEAINYVQAKKIVQGYDDGSYKPDQPINRAELTKIIMATQNQASAIESCNVYNTKLSDVATNAWFAPYVCLAKNKGVVKGYGDGTFKPAQNVTFVEAAKIISLGFGQNLPEDPELWYRPYVNYLSAQSAIPESITAMAKNITRGEMAEMIYRLHAAVENRPAQAFDQGALIPMTDEIKEQQKAAQAATAPNNTTPEVETATPPDTPITPPPSLSCDSCPTGTMSIGKSDTSCGTCQPIANPMICTNCPTGKIGQPGNNCACEQAYLMEQCYDAAECADTQFSCGEGYEFFSNNEQCGCKIKADILEYWLASDASFKINALDEKPPIIHGSYQELTSGNLEAALGNKNMILFFHAPWCPSCVATDQEIKDRITEIPADAVIFKTDYDSEEALKTKFEITSQHSMVIIDKNNALQFKQTGFNFDDIIGVLEKIKEAEDLVE